MTDKMDKLNETINAQAREGRASDPPEPILQYFRYDHLPPKLQEVSKPFCDLAMNIMNLPRSPERTVALRKLLESKDAAVRASL